MPVIDGVTTLLPAPEGYKVDFLHPQRKGVAECYTVVGVGNFIMLLCVGQRLYTKLRITYSFGADDVCLIIAWALSVVVQGLTLSTFAKATAGIHGWEITPEEYVYYNIGILGCTLTYAPGTGFAKMSLLLFYRHIAPQSWFQWSIKITMFVVTGTAVSIFFSNLFACSPTSKSWDPQAAGTCINRPALYIVTAVLGVVTDLALLALPVLVVSRLQMSNRQKGALIALFIIGSLTLVTSIMRLITLFPMLSDPDQTWAIAVPEVWITVEANLQVICASVITSRHFFRHVAPKIMGKFFDESDNTIKHITVPGLRTFGQGTTRLQARKDELELRSFNDTLRPDQGHLSQWEAKGGEADGWDPRDGGSEKGILQTTTTIVDSQQS